MVGIMLTSREIQRQALHIALGCIIVLVSPIIPFAGRVWLGVAIIMFCISLLIKKGFRVPIFYALYDHFGRKDEKERLPGKGYVAYLLGSSVAILLFPDPVAYAAIMVLAFGDSISRLLGPYGAITHPLDNRKFVEGILIGAIVAAFVASIYVPLYKAILGSIVGMFLEAMQLHVLGERVDDNVFIPIIAGIVMVLV